MSCVQFTEHDALLPVDIDMARRGRQQFYAGRRHPLLVVALSHDEQD